MDLLKRIFNKYHFLFFLVVAFLLYGNTLSNDYAIDDTYVINNDLSNKGIKGIGRIFKSHYALGENGNNFEYRPIVKVTFALEYELFKKNPGVSHFINVLLYAICLYLLYHFLKNFLRDQSELSLKLMVCVFAFLPVHTEVVASLKNRDIMLVFIFTFLAIESLGRYLASGKAYRLIASMALATLGFLSKLDALPFMLLSPLLFINKYHLKKLKPVLLVSLTFLTGYLVLMVMKKTLLDKQIQARAYNAFESPLYRPHDFLLNIEAALNSFGFYIKQLIVPYDLSCYYGSYTIPLSLVSAYSLIALAGAALLAYFFIRDIKTRGNLWLGILLFVLPLSMYLNLVKPVPGIVGDRFVFFASIGFTIIACHFLLKPKNGKAKQPGLAGLSSMKAPAKLLLAVFFTSSFLLVVMRNRDWKNPLSLYEADVKKWPSSVKLNVLYANEILMCIRNRITSEIPASKYQPYIGEARLHLQKAYELDSSYYNSANSLAYIESSYFNDLRSSISWLYKADRADSANYEIPMNLCLAYARLNRPDSMEKYLARTLRMQSDNARLIQFMKEKYKSDGQEDRGQRFFENHGLQW